MKRAREDVFTGSQLKRPQTVASHQGETSAQPHRANGGTSSSSSAKQLTTSDALAYLNYVGQMLHGNKEKIDGFLKIMKDFKTQRIDTTGVIARVKELFKGHRKLILGFNTFLPKGYEITLPEEPAANKPVEFSEAVNFIRKIKMRFQGDDNVYKSFLDILRLCRKETRPIEDVYHEVAVLFKDHNDLLGEFTKFFSNTSRTAYARSFVLRDKDSAIPPSLRINLDKKNKSITPHADQHVTVDYSIPTCDKSLMRANKDLQKCEKNGDMREPEREYDHNDGRDFNDTNLVSKYDTDNTSAIKKSECGEEFVFCDKVKERLKKSDGYQEYLNLLDFSSTEIINRESADSKLYRSSLSFNKESIGKPIQDLDLSASQQCSPSYRLLPTNYPIPKVTQRTKLERDVLNDNCLSVATGSEDRSFKHMVKNQYEESLFQCEDDRHELDMLVHTGIATIKRIEDLLDKMNNNNNQIGVPVIIEEYFTALSLRCIERLYSEHGLDVIDALKKNPTHALPIILKRLKEKQEEWSRCRDDFSKVSAPIYAKNHQKSLDHRSNKIRARVQKPHLQRLKKNLKDDDVLLEVSAGIRQPI